MEAIKINVNKEMDGYSFSITPTIRTLIKTLFPNSHPANGIFVGYDTNSNFEPQVSKLENYIYPALFGIENPTDLNKKVNEILFVDIHTGNVIAKVNP